MFIKCESACHPAVLYLVAALSASCCKAGQADAALGPFCAERPWPPVQLHYSLSFSLHVLKDTRYEHDAELLPAAELCTCCNLSLPCILHMAMLPVS